MIVMQLLYLLGLKLIACNYAVKIQLTTVKFLE